MISALTRVAPELADFAPALSVRFDRVRKFLRGIIVKDHSVYLNFKALKNHLGIDRKQARAIEGIVSDFGGPKVSLLVEVVESNSFHWDTTNIQFSFNNKMGPGIIARHYLDKDKTLWCEFHSAWTPLLKGSPEKGHCVYVVVTASPDMQYFLRYKNFTSSDRIPRDVRANKPFVYIGKTSQGLVARMHQHLHSAYRAESMTRFHRLMRGDNEYAPQLPGSMTLVHQCVTEELAYDEEEKYISEVAMNEGLQILNTMGSRDAWLKLGEIERKRISPEQAEEALLRKSQSSKQMWQDPNIAEAIICGNPNNLAGDDVRLIRFLYKTGMDVVQISKKFEVEPWRVRNVVTGLSYKRIL